jgi:nitroreductase
MFSSLIEKRRSIRRYEEREIEKEKVDALIEAALRAPSSMGTNPWRFIIVTEKAMLKKLSFSKEHGSSFLAGAALAIVVCADPKESTVWIEDASIAAIFIQLQAEDLGLGSCWIQIRERNHSKEKTSERYIAELLGIPDSLKVEAIIALGYPAEKKRPHPRESLQYQKAYLGLYGRPYKATS